MAGHHHFHQLIFACLSDSRYSLSCTKKPPKISAKGPNTTAVSAKLQWKSQASNHLATSSARFSMQAHFSCFSGFGFQGTLEWPTVSYNPTNISEQIMELLHKLDVIWHKYLQSFKVGPVPVKGKVITTFIGVKQKPVAVPIYFWPFIRAA